MLLFICSQECHIASFFNPHLLFHKRVSTFDTGSANWGRVAYRMPTAAVDRLEDSCSTRPSATAAPCWMCLWELLSSCQQSPHNGEESSTCTVGFTSTKQAQLKRSRETVLKHSHRMSVILKTKGYHFQLASGRRHRIGESQNCRGWKGPQGS